jgi:tight adherence protein B
MFESLSPELIGAARLFFAVALAVTCLALLWEGVRRMRRERGLTRQLDELSEFTSSDTAQAANPLFHPEDADGGRLVGMLTRFLPRREDLRRLLERADVDWGAGTFVLLTVGLGAGAGLGASLLTVGPFGPVAAAAGGATLPYLYLRRRRIRRAAAFEEHFPEAIELLSRSLRAGHALLTGLEVVAEESPDPVDREFRQVYEQQRFGLPLEESLLGLADRVDSVDVRMFVTSVMIQRESGGNLAEILDNLATLIRERFKFRRQLRVYTAQGRMTGYLLAVLPVAVGLALFAITSDYMIVLVSEPMGRQMLLATALMQVLGFLWIRRIVDVDF